MGRHSRFSPTKLRKWVQEGRGTGTRGEYQPWHKVRRGDPPSRGRSHLLQLYLLNRTVHLLSDGELAIVHFSLLLPGIWDLREQFPLAREDHPCELGAYTTAASGRIVPGSLTLAREMGIKHPRIKIKDDSESWVLTTDLLLTYRDSQNRFQLLAVSVKDPHAYGALTERAKDLLRLEREYWRRQDVKWLLLTRDQYSHDVALNLSASATWALAEERANYSALIACAEMASELDGQCLTRAIQRLEAKLGIDDQQALRLFWQSVWQRYLPIDLHRHYGPAAPIRTISRDDFLALNPLWTQQSACL